VDLLIAAISMVTLSVASGSTQSCGAKDPLNQMRQERLTALSYGGFSAIRETFRVKVASLFVVNVVFRLNLDAS
jgi:hypothetical protein